MPVHEGLRLNDLQSGFPMKPASQYNQEQAGDVVGPTRFHLAFLIQCQLFAQEQILSGHGGFGAQAQCEVMATSQDQRVEMDEHLRERC